MNIFNKVALQGLKKNKTRTIVTIIGVVLSSAMITAVLTFGASLLTYMANGAAQKYGLWHVAFSAADSTFVEEQQDNRRVANTLKLANLGYALLPGCTNPDKPYLFVNGVDDESLDDCPVDLIMGRLPADETEVIISARIASNGGVTYELGDTLTLPIGIRTLNGQTLNQHNPYNTQEVLAITETKTYHIVGVFRRPSFEEYTAPGYTVITKYNDKVLDSTLLVALKNPFSLHSYLKTTGTDDYCVNDYILRFYGLSEDTLFTTLLYTIGIVVIAIIMVGSIFLIYNAFSISLSERMRQFGILASVGATPRQLRKSVLFEGLCIGAIGIPIGLILGIFSIGGVLLFVANRFQSIIYDGVPLNLHISWIAIIIAVIVSLVTILISAYIPAKKAASAPVMECIRQTNEVKLDGKDVKINRLQQFLYGFEGSLALKNFKRNKKRYRSIVLSLILSVVLFISTGSFVTYLKEASGTTVEFTTYDISLSLPHMADDKMLSLYELLKNADGVTKHMYEAIFTFVADADASELTDLYHTTMGSTTSDGTLTIPFDVQFLDDASYAGVLRDLGLNADDYTDGTHFPAVAKMEDVAAPLSETSDSADMFRSTSVNLAISPTNLTNADKNQSKNISATLVNFAPPDVPAQITGYEQRPYFFHLLVPYSMKDEFMPHDLTAAGKGMTFCSTDSKATVEKMELILQASGVTSDYLLYDVNHMMDENKNTIFIANVFAYTFILMITLIALANVFNTISTNIKMRRRELAMLRSVGMGERDFRKMMNYECAFYGIRTLAFGLPPAIASTIVIYFFMVWAGMPTLAYIFPWKDIIISIIGVLLAIFITMLYALAEIKRENIIDALRDETA